MIDINEIRARRAACADIPWSCACVSGEQLDALVEEVERLRGERAAVVAWLREQRAYGTDELLGQGFANVCGILSDAIERGEHRREEER